MASIYLIGSLRNPEVVNVANNLRAAGHDVFDSWFSASPTADDAWRDHSKAKGQDYKTALQDFAAKHVYNFDKHHLDRCEMAVLALPAGKSGHLELGYVIGCGKPGYIILDNPERWDVMYQFATDVFYNVSELISELKKEETGVELKFVDSKLKSTIK